MIEFGKYKIESPCPVPESELRACGPRKAYCDRCQAAVHDVSGFGPEALDRLYQQHEGKVCISFHADRPPRSEETKVTRRLPPWWRSIAATGASLLLISPFASMSLHAANPLSEISQGADSLNSTPSLLLSSVILNQYGENLPDDIVIQVSLPNGARHKVTTNAGFFSWQFQGDYQPTDSIEIRIEAQFFEDHNGTRTYPKVVRRVNAMQPQNAKMELWVEYTYKMKMRGAMKR